MLPTDQQRIKFNLRKINVCLGYNLKNKKCLKYTLHYHITESDNSNFSNHDFFGFLKNQNKKDKK